MGNSIVGAVFLAVVLLTLRAPVKHSRGEGGCCGGGGEPKGKRKKLRGPAAAEKVLRIEGMHCETAKTGWSGCWTRWTAPPPRRI